MSMNVEERKAVAEAWLKAAKSTKQHVMVQIGGTNLPDVLELVGINCCLFCRVTNAIFRHNMPKRMVQILCFVFPNCTTNQQLTSG